MRRIIFFGILVLSARVSAQDPTFSQLYNFPVYYNPAAVGMNQGLHTGIIYRNQWTELPGMFNTYALTMDVQIPKVKSGFGLMLSADNEGEGHIRRKEIASVYCFSIQSSGHQKSKFSHQFQGAIQVAGVFQRIESNLLIYSDQLDPLGGVVNATGAPIPLAQKSYPDFDAGFMWRIAKLRGRNHYNNIIGFSCHHMTKPDNSFEGSDTRLPRKWTMSWSGVLPLTGKKNRGHNIATMFSTNLFTPTVLVEVQDKFVETILGFNLGYLKKFYSGTWLRVGSQMDALIIDCGIDNRNKHYAYRFGFSHDVPVGPLKLASPLITNEITLLFTFYDVFSSGHQKCPYW